MVRQRIKAEEAIGQKFGRLTVINLVNFCRSGGIYKDRKVSCICDCGNTKNISLNKLRTGQTKSCGCLRLENAHKQLANASANNPNLKGKSEPRIATAKIVYRGYSDGDIPFESFLDLSQQNCFYCGSAPLNTTNYYITKNNKYSKERQILGFFTYNGLDRVDNNLPHNLDNVVPCCIHCNKAKLARTKEDFLSWISKIYTLHNM